VSYAADWSEYFGHHPANGDVYFHLDPLWASANVDFIAIDNYMKWSGALFVRYSLARYLRFWLIRSSYEERANADRIVAAIEHAAGPLEAPAPRDLPAVHSSAPNQAP
jgi:hypothetical protein